MSMSVPASWSRNWLTVRLTPCSATEPFSVTKALSSAGTRTVRPTDSSRDSTATTVATASTWPETRWPPSRSDQRNAFSRFTGPGASRPTVRLRLSREMSTANPCSSGRITVMQAPLMATESPSFTSEASRPPQLTKSRRPWASDQDCCAAPGWANDCGTTSSMRPMA